MLTDEMQEQGAWLFRWRSYMPLALAPLIILALLNFEYPYESRALDITRESICLLVALAGLALRVMTVGFAPRGSSGRNTKSIKGESLSTTGMYSLVRHPLYLANFIIFVAFLMFIGQWWLILLGSVVYWQYYERIMIAEEAFLNSRHGEPYRLWTLETPAILPRLHGWKAPALPFSWRSALRREYSTLFLIVSALAAAETVAESIVHGRLYLEPAWIALFLVVGVFYLAMRTLKKSTTLLDVEGR